MTTLPSAPPAPWRPLSSSTPSAAPSTVPSMSPQSQVTAAITEIPEPLPPKPFISLSIEESIGILGLLLSCITAYILWRKDRVKADVSDVVVVPINTATIGPFLEFTVVNKSALQLSIHAVDVVIDGFLYKHRSNNYTSFTSRFHREEVIRQSIVVTKPGVQIHFARFQPILLDAFQSTRVFVELDPHCINQSDSHLLAADSQGTIDGTTVQKSLTLRLYTSRKELEFVVQARLVGSEEWMRERSRILESEAVLP